MRNILTTDPREGVAIEDANAFIDGRVDAASTERQLDVLLAFISALRMEIDAVADDDDGEVYLVRFDALKTLARMLCY